MAPLVNSTTSETSLKTESSSSSSESEKKLEEKPATTHASTSLLGGMQNLKKLIDEQKQEKAATALAKSKVDEAPLFVGEPSSIRHPKPVHLALSTARDNFSQDQKDEKLKQLNLGDERVPRDLTTKSMFMTETLGFTSQMQLFT